jgi:hypothetical protein
MGGAMIALALPLYWLTRADPQPPVHATAAPPVPREAPKPSVAAAPESPTAPPTTPPPSEPEAPPPTDAAQPVDAAAPPRPPARSASAHDLMDACRAGDGSTVRQILATLPQAQRRMLLLQCQKLGAHLESQARPSVPAGDAGVDAP